MTDGRLVAHGPPAEVITEALVDDVFGLRCRVVTDPVAGTPMVIPLGRHTNVAAQDLSAQLPAEIVAGNGHRPTSSRVHREGPP